MHHDRRTILLGRADGDLELAWQEQEFRVDGRPLPQDFRQRARVDQLVGRDPAKASVVMLRTQLPDVWIACISTCARRSRMSGTWPVRSS
jgi:hypothetical protein